MSGDVVTGGCENLWGWVEKVTVCFLLQLILLAWQPMLKGCSYYCLSCICVLKRLPRTAKIATRSFFLLSVFVFFSKRAFLGFSAVHSPENGWVLSSLQNNLSQRDLSCLPCWWNEKEFTTTELNTASHGNLKFLSRGMFSWWNNTEVLQGLYINKVIVKDIRMFD